MMREAYFRRVLGSSYEEISEASPMIYGGAPQLMTRKTELGTIIIFRNWKFSRQVYNV